MEKLLEIASKVSTPLALGGIIAVLLSGISIQILRSKNIRHSQDYKTKVLIFKRFFWLSILATVFGFIGFILPLLKPSPSPASTPTSPILLSERLVTLDAHNEDIKNVLETIARQLGLALAVDRNFRGSLSITAKESKAKEVLNQICELRKCKWSIQEGNPPILMVLPGTTQEVP